MFCQCNQKATVQGCKSLFCGTCFLRHFTIRCKHQPNQILTTLDPSDRILLNQELNYRIITLIQLSLKSQLKPNFSLKLLRIFITP